MQDFSTMPLDALLKPEGYDCACGNHHETHLRYLKTGSGAVRFFTRVSESLRRAICAAFLAGSACAAGQALWKGSAEGFGIQIYRCGISPETPQDDESCVDQ